MERIFSEEVKQPANSDLELASDLLFAVRQRTQQMYERTEAEIEKTLKTAYEAGFQLGHIDGLRRIIKADRLYARTIERSRGEILRLVATLGKEVLGEAFSLNAAHLLIRLDDLINKVKSSKVIKLFVPPEDFPVINQHIQNATRELATKIEVTSDSSLSTGDIRIESEQGIIEAKIDNYIERFTDYAKKFISNSF